jgi:hypothetical protein
VLKYISAEGSGALVLLSEVCKMSFWSTLECAWYANSRVVGIQLLNAVDCWLGNANRSNILSELRRCVNPLRNKLGALIEVSAHKKRHLGEFSLLNRALPLAGMKSPSTT